jgi:nitrilase
MADNVSMSLWLENYIDNSLTVDSVQWNMLVKAATDNNIYIVPGFSHKENGALYMAQALIKPDGTSFVRHKLRPSSGERGVWSDGTTDDLRVIATPYGRWGILECWEHFHPAMTFNTQAQTETLHIAAWPCKFSFGLIYALLANGTSTDTPDAGDKSAAYWESLEVNLAAARLYAVNAQAPLVFSSIGNVRFLDNEGLDLEVVNAAIPSAQQPLVYHSFNTTGLAATVPYSTNSEQSWGVLQEMVAGFPAYIPKVLGVFTNHRTFSVADLISSVKSS